MNETESRPKAHNPNDQRRSFGGEEANELIARDLKPKIGILGKFKEAIGLRSRDAFKNGSVASASSLENSLYVATKIGRSGRSRMSKKA